MINIKNRYLVLFGALLAQVTIAALYAWSIFGTALQNERGWGEDEILLTFSISVSIFAFSTIFSGRLVDRKGPRPALVIGGLLYGGGLILSSFATTPIMLYLTYGVLTGAGVGFVYVCPLSTLVKWFPKHTGMITGLSVAIFGGGSIIFKEVISSLLVDSNVSSAFLNLGIISIVLILTGALFTNNPEGFEKQAAKKSDGDYTTGEMMKTFKFRLMFLMYFLACIPGLLVLGTAKNIGIEVAGLESSLAAGIISILAISNATSRLVSGALSDKIGTLNVLKSVFIVTVISLLILSFFASNKTMFYVGIIGVAIGFGGFLSLFPTFTNQQFGKLMYASNYGVVYQAYGLAALAGVYISSVSGSFTNTFIIAAICSAFGLGLSYMIKEEKAVKIVKATP